MGGVDASFSMLGAAPCDPPEVENNQQGMQLRPRSRVEEALKPPLKPVSSFFNKFPNCVCCDKAILTRNEGCAGSCLVSGNGSVDRTG